MAEIRRINCLNQPYLRGKNCYKVTGPLTIQDVNDINRSTNKIILIMDNTKGQDSEIIERISSKNVQISVVGGLDYFNKEKFNEGHYIERTMYSPRELARIIRYFEKIERNIKPSWTPLEKSMYVYKMLTKDLHYKYDNESEYENNKDIVRSLSGLLYKRLVCSGFALVFKEAMDRIGVPCVYQNLQHHHSWNIIKVEGEYRAIELTWECSSKKNNECTFDFFNQNPNFYGNRSHNISSEKEEIRYNIVPYTKAKIEQHRKRIESPLYETYPGNKMSLNTNRDVQYIEISNEEPTIREFLVVLDDKIAIVYLPQRYDPKMSLTKANIMYAATNNFCIGNITFPPNFSQSNHYQRYDGTTFVIRGNGKRFTTSTNEIMYEYHYYEYRTNGDVRRATIVSENRLDLEDNPTRKQLIANRLLSQERMKRKMNHYNGYVGYIGQDSVMYCNQDFEQKDLNIPTRK